MENNKTGLILEGGGMRGAYTSGVLKAFMDENIEFPYIIGVSAGANNGSNFISQQKERNREVFVDYVGDKNFSGFKHWLKDDSYFNMDFLFNTLPNKLVPFNYETFFNSPVTFKVCVTNAKTGQAEYFSKDDFNNKKFVNQVLKASSSLPIISKPVRIKEELYFDGGITDSIPLDKSIEDGNKYNVVILTRNKEYRKKGQVLGLYSKHYLRKYPKILDALERRHIKYNIDLEKIEDLEKEGFVYVFRPIDEIVVGRLEKDPDRLKGLYNQGYYQAKEQMKDFKNWLKHIPGK